MKKPIISISVIVAFITPLISVAIGLITAWLFVHIHILGVFHLSQTGINQAIAGMVVFVVTAGLHYASAHYHWLPVVFTELRAREAVKAAGPAKANPDPATVPPGTKRSRL